ncbi:hypothetical protein SELMODRAFT_411574 [Selaginella moellendorffii]|uniref:Uncharacterized protein n=1 Tax=Selaginella moellendorffii TaxID=88036 RepID=D8RID1_SELML|nr:hypothetical protein SELMODRAFT_411574 [Selaginella moellendorffii]
MQQNPEIESLERCVSPTSNQPPTVEASSGVGFSDHWDHRRALELSESRGSNTYGNDLLGLMLKECDSSSNFTSRDLIEECKTFYIAGHETTATLLTWTLMLLGGYPEWQECARAEVYEVCGNEIPDGESVSRLKLIPKLNFLMVGMILYETLRLYPPVVEMTRECVEESWLQDLHVPRGVSVSFPIVGLHQDKELWGEDAGQFNPDRFKDGISSACKHPNAFMPFSFGLRLCVGQSFAMIEAKVILAMILQQFLFRLSPNYRHSPAMKFGLKPIHGVPLVLGKCDACSWHWKSRSYLHCSWIQLNETERASRLYHGLRMKMNQFHKTCEAMKQCPVE